jgi:curved DNA-binding protein CbpA
MPSRDAYEVLQVHPKADQAILHAAFRILAAKYHPDRDQSPGANRRMAELNIAYEAVRSEDRRVLYDKAQTLHVPIAPVVTPYAAAKPAPAPASAETVDFGRYAGWTLEELAKQDPDYLVWLSRHSSGIRFRRRIGELLARRASPPPAQRRSRR